MKTNRKKAIYWLDPHPSHLTNRRCELLAKLGFDCQLHSTTSSLLESFLERKSDIILVSQLEDLGTSKQAIQTLTHHPETQGVKFILSIQSINQELSSFAAVHAFRDVVPEDLSDKEWHKRWSYAVGLTNIKNYQPKVSVNTFEIASLKIPARIISLNDNEIKIEARLNAKNGTLLTIGGPLCHAMGLRRISLNVKEHKRTDLNFRFSDSLTATWSVPQESLSRHQQIVSRLKQNNGQRRCKVFIAIKNPMTRAKIIDALDPLRFDINVALRVHSLVHEPSFFGPQVVIVDEALLKSLKPEIRSRMLSSFSEKTSMLVIGAETQGLQTFMNEHSEIRWFAHNSPIEEGFRRKVLTEVLDPDVMQQLRQGDGNAHLSFDHPYSTAHIIIPARLTQLDTRGLKIDTPHRIQDYALAQVDSGAISGCFGQSALIKIEKSQELNKPEDKSFPYQHTAHLSELSASMMRSWSTSIVNHVSKTLLAPDNSPTSVQNAETPPNNVLNISNHPEKLNIQLKNSETAIQELSIQPFADEPKPVQKDDDTKKVKSPPARDHGAQEAERRIRGRKNAPSVVIPPLYGGRAMRSFITFVFISILFFGSLVYFVEFIEPLWPKSGKVFSESIRRVLPHRFEDKENNPDQN